MLKPASDHQALALPPADTFCRTRLAVPPAVPSVESLGGVMGQLSNICRELGVASAGRIQEGNRPASNSPSRDLLSRVLVSASGLYDACAEIIKDADGSAKEDMNELCIVAAARGVVKNVSEAISSAVNTSVPQNPEAKEANQGLARQDEDFLKQNQPELTSLMTRVVETAVANPESLKDGFSAAIDSCGTYLFDFLNKQKEENQAYSKTQDALSGVVGALRDFSAQLSSSRIKDASLQEDEQHAAALAKEFDDKLSELKQSGSGTCATTNLAQRLKKVHELSSSLEELTEDFLNRCLKAGVSREKVPTLADLSQMDESQRRCVLEDLFEDYSDRIAKKGGLSESERAALEDTLHRSMAYISRLQGQVLQYLNTAVAEYAEMNRIAQSSGNPNWEHYQERERQLHRAEAETQNRFENFKVRLSRLQDSIQKRQLGYGAGLSQLRALTLELEQLLAASDSSCPLEGLEKDRTDLRGHCDEAQAAALVRMAAATDEKSKAVEEEKDLCRQIFNQALDQLQLAYQQAKNEILSRISDTWSPIFDRLYNKDLIELRKQQDISPESYAVSERKHPQRFDGAPAGEKARYFGFVIDSAVGLAIEKLHSYLFIEQVFNKIFPETFRGFRPDFVHMTAQEKAELEENLKKLERRLGHPVFVSMVDGRLSVLDELQAFSAASLEHPSALS